MQKKSDNNSPSFKDPHSFNSAFLEVTISSFVSVMFDLEVVSQQRKSFIVGTSGFHSQSPASSWPNVVLYHQVRQPHLPLNQLIDNLRTVVVLLQEILGGLASKQHKAKRLIQGSSLLNSVYFPFCWLVLDRMLFTAMELSVQSSPL